MTAPSPDTLSDTADEYREFAYIVSHDLQGPTRAMVELSRLLKADRAAELTEEEALYLSAIVESGEKLQGMISGLLAFSRLNGQASQIQRLDMGELAATAANAVRARQPEVALSFDGADLPVVMADRQGIEQVLEALFDNSLKFRGAGDALRVRLSSLIKDGFHQFRFADTGIGVAADFLSAVFKPLRKLHADSDYPGIGMGLTLARKIIRRQGGDMWAETGRGDLGGLCVCFTLPVTESTP